MTNTLATANGHAAPPSIWHRLGVKSDTLAQAVALALFVYIAILLIAEVGSRMEYLRHLELQIADKSQELNVWMSSSLNGKDDAARAAMTPLPAPESAMPAVRSSDLNDRLLTMESDIYKWKISRDLVQILIFQGAMGTGMDIDQIRDKEGRYPSPLFLAGTESSSYSSFFSYIFGREIIALSSSNILLALLLCACGTIGALTGGLRTDEFTTFRDICLGLGTGFLYYLTIRGGKDLFVANTMSGSGAINPYSASLTAVLAGLFSERFYGLLNKISKTVTNRLEAAFSPPDDKAGGGPGTPGVPPALAGQGGGRDGHGGAEKAKDAANGQGHPVGATAV